MTNDTELEHMALRSIMVDAINIIKEQAEIIYRHAKEQYALDVGGKVYKHSGVSQFHAISDIIREASAIEFAASAIDAQIILLDKLYNNEPIISSEDAEQAKRITGSEDIF